MVSNNGNMQISLTLTKRQKQALKAIYTSIRDFGYPPTLADLREELSVSSNQAVLDFLKILESKGFIKKEEGTARGIKILEKGYETLSVNTLIPYVGISVAGPFTPSFEDIQWTDAGEVEITENVYMVKIKGDSMVDADLNDGDYVLVKEAKEFKNKDIVLARNNGDSTIKRLVNERGKIYLKPENPKYPNIPIYPETRLLGKVIGKIGGKR